MDLEQDRWKTKTLWAASVLWMCFCLFLSWQPGEDTVSLSEAMAQTIQRVVHLFGVEIDLNTLHAWLRKAAHVVTFFISGSLFFCSFVRSLKRRPRASLLSFLFAAALCSICAVAAEVGKIWIPGRHLQWDETLLNVAGVVCGAGIAELTRKLLHVKRR
jgi:VanZ family protein